jgi:hypothetical protein
LFTTSALQDRRLYFLGGLDNTLRVKNPFSAASERIANGAPITTTSRAACKVADEWSQEHKPDDDETV